MSKSRSVSNVAVQLLIDALQPQSSFRKNYIEIIDLLRTLRNCCASSAANQNLIANDQALNSHLHGLLFDTGNDEGRADSSGSYLNNDAAAIMQQQAQIKSLAWQLLANVIVNNSSTQHTVWALHGEALLLNCAAPPIGRITDIKLMILYNIFKGGTGILSEQQALLAAVRVWQAILAEQSDANFEFLHFLFEYFIVEMGRSAVRCYATCMEPLHRVAFLDYLSSYLRNGSPNGVVHHFLLQHISKEFKLKSDGLLRQVAQTPEQIQPRVIHGLLRIIACASGSEEYAPFYATDHALFLNVSSLLRCLIRASKEPNATAEYSPMLKLEEVAPAARVDCAFESEVSYELKTLLVRCVANLLYKNRTNQGYCLDTQLLPAIMECTNMDARNPLIKEWSILAIRNACIGCPEIQQVVADLQCQGLAENNALRELNLDMGALRIKPSEE